jgi:hypothetical protein
MMGGYQRVFARVFVFLKRSNGSVGAHHRLDDNNAMATLVFPFWRVQNLLQLTLRICTIFRIFVLARSEFFLDPRLIALNPNVESFSTINDVELVSISFTIERAKSPNPFCSLTP